MSLMVISKIKNYLNTVKIFLYEYLSKFGDIKNNLMIRDDKYNTVLHIRRGDYVAMGEDLSIDFYEESLNKMNKNIDKFSYDIFTDDEDWVKIKNCLIRLKIYLEKIVLTTIHYLYLQI